MTSVLPPSMAFVRQHGALLTQLGATKIETPSPLEIKLTYTSNNRAVQAGAAFNDTVYGAKLVIDNQSLTADAPQPTAHGVASLLKGVQGVSATLAETSPRQLLVSAEDAHTTRGLGMLLRPQPAVIDGPVELSVFHKPAGELPAAG